MPLIGENTTRVERGQYKPSLGGSNGVVTRTISLSNSGQSLDRMALRWGLGGFYWWNGHSSGVTAFNVFGPLSGAHYGTLLSAYLSAVNEITLKIKENTTAGVAANSFNYEVERW